MANENVSDDEISLTSTGESDQASEYEVETILAEDDRDFPDLPDGIKYLVRWHGYSLDRCTWEPEVNFNQTDSIRDWEEKKQRISEGVESSFDVSAWEKDLSRKDEEKNARKARRAAKRQRLASLGKPHTSRSAPDAQTVKPKPKPKPSHKTSTATRTRRLGPARSIFADRIHPARQGLLRPPAPREQPPVLSIGTRAVTHEPRTLSHNPKELKRIPYTLSWKHKFESASLNRPIEPDINQLDLRRPSEWDSAPSTKAVKSGNSNANSPTSHNAASLLDSRYYDPHQKPGVMSLRTNNGSLRDVSNPVHDETSTYHGNFTDRNNTRATISQFDHGQESSPRDPRSHRALKQSSRPSAGEFNLQFPPRVPKPGRKVVRTRFGKRWWNLGDVYVNVYFGPDKNTLGEARICGIGFKETRDIMRTKNMETKQIEIWFRDLCTLDQYQILCDGVRNEKIANGWMEGFDETEMDLGRLAEILWREDQIAIARIDNSQVLLAYPPNSRDFCFLDDKPSEPRGYLNLTLRSSLGPIDRLVEPERTSQLYPPRVSNTFTDDYPGRGVKPSSGTQPPRNLNVAQESYANPTTARPTLKPLDTDLHTPAPSLCSGNTHIVDTGSDKGLASYPKAQPFADAMDLDPRPAKTPTSDHVSSNAIFTPTSALNSLIIHTPIENSPIQRKGFPSTESMNLDPGPPPAALHHPVANLPATVDLDELFRTRFGISFEKLADSRSQSEMIFYVWFPDTSELVKQEKELVMKFLHKPTSLLFSNSVEGQWERFVSIISKRMIPGVLLLHESFVDYHKIPFLKELLHKSDGIWNISLSTPLRYVNHPLHAQRLFPHGGVFLLTEDFMVREPAATMIILEWFHKFASKKFPGNWKIMLRPGIVDWLLQQIELDDESSMRWWLGIHCLLLKLGFLSTDDLTPTIEVDPIDSLILSPPTLPSYGTRTADASPDIPKNCSREHLNTDHLGEFFAGWSLVNAHRFRRFFMVTALKPLDRWLTWQHIELNYQSFFKDERHHLEAAHAVLFKDTSVPFPLILKPQPQFQPQPQPQCTPKPPVTGTPKSLPPKPPGALTPNPFAERQPSSAALKSSSGFSYGQGYQ